MYGGCTKLWHKNICQGDGQPATQDIMCHTNQSIFTDNYIQSCYIFMFYWIMYSMQEIACLLILKWHICYLSINPEMGYMVVTGDSAIFNMSRIECSDLIMIPMYGVMFHDMGNVCLMRKALPCFWKWYPICWNMLAQASQITYLKILIFTWSISKTFIQWKLSLI